MYQRGYHCLKEIKLLLGEHPAQLRSSANARSVITIIVIIIIAFMYIDQSHCYHWLTGW